MAIKLADIASKASNVSTIGSAVLGVVNLVKSLFGNSEKKRREQEAEQDARQLRMQGEFNKMGVANSKELADYEQMLKMKMWQDTNYSAQMREAEKAGLSKAALLGAGGGSTAQGASVSGMSGGNASDAASAQQAGTQSAMAEAQIRNMNADSALKQAQAVKTAGVDTTKAGKEIEGIGADITNKELQADLQKLEKDLRGRTLEDQIELVQRAREKAYMDNAITSVDKNIAMQTMDQKIEGIKQEWLGKEIENRAKEKGIKLTDAQIDKIYDEIEQNWAKIDIADNEAGIKEFMANMQAQNPGLMNVVGGEIRRSFNMLNEMSGAKDGGYYRYQRRKANRRKGK